MNLTPEMRRLMARARERIAEQNAHDKRQRAANFTIDGRHAEFCGAFRELLDMLVCELERAAACNCPAGMKYHAINCSCWPGMERALTDPPEYDPDGAEAQRIAEVFADARAEQDRGL